MVIPTYNYARFVCNAVDSVLAQTFADYEIIVVDDGSSDNTGEVLARYGNRIKYIRQENAGASTARNTGIVLAQGKFVAFLDADDLWLPQKLEKQVRFLDDNPGFGMVFSDMSHCVDGAMVHVAYLRERCYRYVAQGNIYNNLLREGFVFTPTVMLRRECFDLVGLFDVRLCNCEDVDLWFRVADRYQIGFMDEPLAVRNQHGANVTGNSEDYLKAPVLLMERLYAANSDRERKTIINERLQSMFYNLGYYYFSVGRMPDCRKYMLKAMAAGRRPGGVLKYYALSLLPPGIIRWLKGDRSSSTTKHGDA